MTCFKSLSFILNSMPSQILLHLDGVSIKKCYILLYLFEFVCYVSAELISIQSNVSHIQ